MADWLDKYDTGEAASPTGSPAEGHWLDRYDPALKQASQPEKPPGLLDRLGGAVRDFFSRDVYLETPAGERVKLQTPGGEPLRSGMRHEDDAVALAGSPMAGLDPTAAYAEAGQPDPSRTALETAASLGTGMLSYPGQITLGLTGIASGMSREEVDRLTGDFARATTYVPGGKMSQALSEAAGQGFDTLLWPAHKLDELVSDLGYPRAAYVARVAAELAIFKGLHALSEKSTGFVRKKFGLDESEARMATDLAGDARVDTLRNLFAEKMGLDKASADRLIPALTEEQVAAAGKTNPDGSLPGKTPGRKVAKDDDPAKTRPEEIAGPAAVFKSAEESAGVFEEAFQRMQTPEEAADLRNYLAEEELVSGPNPPTEAQLRRLKERTAKAVDVASRIWPFESNKLYAMAPGMFAGFAVDDDGHLTFDPARAILGTVLFGAGIGITSRIRKGIGKGKFLRQESGLRSRRNLDVVMEKLAGKEQEVIDPAWDQVRSLQEAREWADAMTWLDPEVVDTRQSLRYRENRSGFIGNAKMAHGNLAFPRGRNTWDFAGCGREKWARENGLDATQACYGMACYAESIAKSKGRGSVATGEMMVNTLPRGMREEVTAYWREHGIEAAKKQYPDLVLREYAPGELKDAPQGKLSIKRVTAGGMRPARVSTNLAPAKGQDIRLGVDTDGSAWLSNKDVLDAILKADPRTVTVYSSAYHKPPPPHPLSGRSIINVTVSGWHPLPETFARIRWAQEARKNGWNVILREVVADPEKFSLDEVRQYNRLHDAIMATDLFVMQQPLHKGSTYGEPIGGLPGCCVGSKKNPHTCDQCEVAEGLGHGFQQYYGIGERPGERILPDSDYAGRPEPGIEQTSGTTLYSGLPVQELSQGLKFWEKYIGGPLWDKLITQKIPDALEKIPVAGRGVSAVRRALDYDYRGDLQNAKGYVSLLDETRQRRQLGAEYGVDLGNRLSRLPEESQLRVGQAITGHDVKLTPAEARLASEASWALLELGKQAVDYGLLSEETFFKNAGKYMPRLYTRREYQGLLKAYGEQAPNRLDLDRFRRRKDIPREVRRQMGEILTPGYPVAKGIVQLTHSIETARWLKTIADNPDWALRRTPKSEVLSAVESAIAAAREASPEAPLRDILEGVAQDFPDLAIYARRVKKGGKFRTETVIENALEPPEGWVKLKDDAKLGELSGAYVHPEVARDIEWTMRAPSAMEKVMRKWLSRWKYGKVVLSAKTHIRNMYSNALLAHLGGMPLYEQPLYLARAAREMRSGGKYWRMAKREGLLSGTYIQGELRGLFDQVESQMNGVRAGSLEDTMTGIGRAVQKIRAAGKRIGDVYQAEEQWFKLAKFMHDIRRRGMSPKEAAADASKWLFDYGRVTRFQERYRNSLFGAPFATFTFKAIPRVLEAAVKTPQRYVLPAAIIWALEEAARDVFGDTPQTARAKKDLRPKWMQGSFLGIPNFARIPVADAFGREYWLNLSYILPWGELGESGGLFGIPGGLMPFSHPLTKEIAQQLGGAGGYDWFWEEPIVKPEDTAGLSDPEALAVSAKKRGLHALQTAVPTPVMDAVKLWSAAKGEPDYRGRERSMAPVLADVLLGLKAYPVDYEEQALREIGKHDPKRSDVARRIISRIRTAMVKRAAVKERGGDTELYDRMIAQYRKQLAGMARKGAGIARMRRRLKGKGS